MIDYAIISCDDKCNLIEYWPTVASAWKKLGIEPLLAYVTKEKFAKWRHLENYGHVVPFWPNKIMTAKNNGLLTRWKFAAAMNEKKCIITDLDMLPMNAAYFLNNSKYISSNNILFYGGNCYIKHNINHYPSCYICAEGNVFAKFFSEDWKIIKGDNTDIRYDSLSDEKLMIHYWRDIEKHGLERVIIERRFFQGTVAGNRIDRYNWPNFEKPSKEMKYILKNKLAIDAHMPHEITKKILDGASFLCQNI